MYTKTLAVHVPIQVNFPTANQITRRCKIKLTALHWRCSWSLFLLLCWGLCCLQTLTTEVLKSFSFFCYVPEIIGVISALSTAAWDLQWGIWMGRCTQYKGAPDGCYQCVLRHFERQSLGAEKWDLLHKVDYQFSLWPSRHYIVVVSCKPVTSFSLIRLLWHSTKWSWQCLMFVINAFCEESLHLS